MQDSPEAIIRRNLWQAAALLAPGTVVSHRTAFENRQSPDGSVSVTGQYPRRIQLPGLTIRQLDGAGPVEWDMPYMGSLFLAFRPRTFLENLLPSRQRERVPKTVGREELERRLTEMLRVGGEEALNRLRDAARAIAPALRLEEQFRILDGIVGALLRSRSATLSVPATRAYSAKDPYDPQRLPRFQSLFTAVRNGSFPDCPDRASASPAFQNAAFFGAYFSNYIEGTEFPIEQAIRIVFEGKIPMSRPADAHDVLGAYRLVASREEMSQRPGSFEEFEGVLTRRHAVIMEGRSEMLPGQFKEEPNQAGATLFVDPTLVRGTLRQGFGMYRALGEPFARALFMMFLVAEVHRFKDGNGRLARVMRNAELISRGQTRILIPSVYRHEYTGSLKRLTNSSDPDSLIRVMDYAQAVVSRIDFTDLETARQALAAHNAFQDPADDVKLRMPPQSLR